MANIISEPIQLLVTNPKIRWGMSQEKVSLFSSELNCNMPFNMFGETVICRYQKTIEGVPLYITPAFNKTGLFHLKGCFEQGERLESYKTLIAKIVEGFGEPDYTVKAELRGNKFESYPCDIWVFPDSILEVGIQEIRFVPTGYVWLTKKESCNDVYDDEHIETIGWDPNEFIV